MATVLGVAVAASPGTAGVAAALATDGMFPTASAPNDRWIQDPQNIDSNVPCRTDYTDTYHHMDRADAFELESPDRGAVINTMNRDYGPTDLYIVDGDAPVLSGPGETDIVHQEGRVDNVPPDVMGVTWFDDAVNGYSARFGQQYVRIRGYVAYDRGLAATRRDTRWVSDTGLCPHRSCRTSIRRGCLVFGP
ncbi:hypothetical protein [Nocardiopsis sp. NRRL B-16309]|uniref:hypothetical protein n=1 Tax=Nocardiopsis sp. NRRL B-16309 TaxID=1519494 RepID=UPI000AD87D52|nr:hypothetical protein [Nocardiopsis sp. NRRL B-16309]